MNAEDSILSLPYLKFNQLNTAIQSAKIPAIKQQSQVTCNAKRVVQITLTSSTHHHMKNLNLCICAIPLYINPQRMVFHHNHNTLTITMSFLPTFLLLLFILASAGATYVPNKIGHGYRLVSLQESPDGGLVGLLQLKQRNNIYGPDIPHLQLSVK